MNAPGWPLQACASSNSGVEVMFRTVSRPSGEARKQVSLAGATAVGAKQQRPLGLGQHAACDSSRVWTLAVGVRKRSLSNPVCARKAPSVHGAPAPAGLGGVVQRDRLLQRAAAMLHSHTLGLAASSAPEGSAAGLGVGVGEAGWAWPLETSTARASTVRRQQRMWKVA